MTTLTTPVPLDPAVAAAGPHRAANPDVQRLLAELSHHDPDHHPLTHARIWQQLLAVGPGVRHDVH